MQRRNTTKNVFAGLFLLGALILAVILSFVFSGMSFEKVNPYVIRFSLDVGAAGLQPGSQVTLGGRPVGQVWELSFDPPAGVPEAILVEVRLDADLTLYDNARAYLVQPLLGTLSTINIASPGDPGSGSPLAPGGEITGSLAPPGFLAQAGYGPEQQAQLQRILSRLDEASETLQTILEPFESRSERLAMLTEQTLTDVSETARNMRLRLDQWSQGLDQVIADLEWFSGELQPTILAMRDGVDEAGLLFRRGNEFIDENRRSIESSIEAFRDAMRQIDEETVPQYTGLARDARKQIEDLDPTLDEASAFIQTDLIPSLRRALANGEVASGFLKHAIAEIRDQPWRLLIRPTKKELGEQLTYDAARTYADAVSELRSASEALAIALAGDDPTLRTRERIEELSARLDEAFARYEQAERELLLRLVSPDGTPGEGLRTKP